ncbi:peptidase M4 [Deinococcus detaillensis]|uniref:Peptidase M4 n=1 Tax=Deinococcus detaillensis TaxID=2592048 RepID=A0A553UZB0_9DEIO|nr:peptidase M4 [Deinococcus detaillensis]
MLIGAGLLLFGLLGSVFAQSMMDQPGNAGAGQGNGQGYGQGMMGGNGVGGGMMGGGAMGSGMMSLYAPSSRPISQDEARRRAQGFVGRYGSQVKTRDFMVFAENYYVQVVDATTGAGLAEVLVDRYTGIVQPEPGPDMLWNTRFGMQGGQVDNGMMGGSVSQGRSVPSTPVRYTKVAAQKLADTFLAGYLPGGKVIEGMTFPGYYTFDYGRKAIEGMLSVNAFTGEVWVHGWHGAYLGEVK